MYKHQTGADLLLFPKPVHLLCWCFISETGVKLLFVGLYYGLCNIFCSSFDLHPLQIFIRCYCTVFVLWGKDCISTSFKYSHVLHKEIKEFSSQLVSNSNFFRTWNLKWLIPLCFQFSLYEDNTHTNTVHFHQCHIE